MMFRTGSKAPPGAFSVPLHRRALLTGLGAAGLFALGGGRFSAAATAPAEHRIGAVTAKVISDGVLNVPLAFSLPETSPEDAAALFKAHGLPEQGSPSQTNVVLIRSGDETILIDAGSGPTFQQTAGKLQENMEAAGIDPASITKVVFTHGHADHLWGAIDDFDDDLRFPNARYVISAAEWDFWTDPDTPGRVPDALKGMAMASARILKQLGDRIDRRKDGDSLAPGLSYLATPGHTPGHMAILVESEGRKLIVGGDVLTNTAISFSRPGWRMGADYDRDRGIATRRKLLDLLASDKIPLIGFHLAWPGLGMVERKDNAYRFIPL